MVRGGDFLLAEMVGPADWIWRGMAMVGEEGVRMHPRFLTCTSGWGVSFTGIRNWWGVSCTTRQEC